MTGESAIPAAAPRRPRGVFARDTSMFDRGISFYDAIYGFAITLLIANIDIPTGEAWASLDALLATGLPSQLGGFALSFIVIAVFWRVNVDLVNRLVGLDSATTIMNLLAAAFIVLIPFTTQGISDPHSSEYGLPTALYALNIALASLAQSAMFAVAHHRGLEVEPMTRRRYLRNWLDTLPVPVIFLASIPITLAWGADAGKLTWATLLIIGPLTARLVRQPDRETDAAG